MTTAISIRNLVKAFPAHAGGTPTRAVDDVSLDIEPGELFFLLGPSGCGKTTLLRMIAGFIDPDEGQILFAASHAGDAQTQTGDPRPEAPHPATDDASSALRDAPAPTPKPPQGTTRPEFRDVTHLPPNKRNTGMVFQSYALWPHMTVEQNVAFGLGVRKVAPDQKARRVADALELVQMSHLATRKPNQLSGGQQQRVALARALVIRPDVLLLDEPLSNLDAKLRLELRAEIRRVCKESGITTIYVTHDQKEALSMADRVAIMRAGRVVQSGTPLDLYRRPASRFVAEFLGETNILKGQARPVGAMIEVKAGPLTLRADPRKGATPTTGPVLVSIRPEAITLAHAALANGLTTGADAVTADIASTTYLGEIAQHTLRLADGSTLRAAELNPLGRLPGQRPGADAPARVALTILPHDVVLLPTEP